MKPGEWVIWLRSPHGNSIWRCGQLERIPGVIVRICKRRIRIRVWLRGKEKVVSVDPENVIFEAADQLATALEL